MAIKPSKEELRGISVAGMDLVEEYDEHLIVKSPSIRGKQTEQKVWRDEFGGVNCDCLVFTEKAMSPEANGRCEHIYAVKHALTNFKDNLTERKNKRKETNTMATNQVKQDAQSNDIPWDDKKPKSYSESLEQQTSQPVAAPSTAPFDWFAALHARVPPEFIKHLDVNWGSGSVPYISWDYVADVLDNVVQEGWSFSVDSLTLHDASMIVTALATISITLADGSVVKRTNVGTGVGFEKNGYVNLETAYKSAVSDALKRAATLFGIGRELYEKDTPPVSGGGGGFNNGGQSSNAGQQQRQGNGGGGGYNNNVDTNAPDFNPVAKSLSDLVTAKQLGMIRAIAREIGIDSQEFCQEHFDCVPDELSKKAASALIQKLQDEQRLRG